MLKLGGGTGWSIPPRPSREKGDLPLHHLRAAHVDLVQMPTRWKYARYYSGRVQELEGQAACRNLLMLPDLFMLGEVDGYRHGKRGSNSIEAFRPFGQSFTNFVQAPRFGDFSQRNWRPPVVAAFRSEEEVVWGRNAVDPEAGKPGQRGPAGRTPDPGHGNCVDRKAAARGESQRYGTADRMTKDE